MNLLRLNVLNLAAHWGGINIQAAQNIGSGGHANSASRQFEMVIAAVDFDAQSSLQLFDIVIKRATQAQQTGIVDWLQGNFASVYVQTVPLMHELPEDKRLPADKGIIHADVKRRKHCNKYGDVRRKYKARQS